jgi:predicted nucleic acid-binding protein
MEHLVDTNILIRYLNGDLSEELSQILDNQTIKISVITKIEILSWTGYKEAQITYLLDFLETCVILPLDDSVVDRTIFLRKKYKLIGLPI